MIFASLSNCWTYQRFSLFTQSTGYAWWRRGVTQQADENYAREVLQLFSVGLYRLHQNGTLQLDENSKEIRTYTNEDLTEYAKVYVGLTRSTLRGNVEDPRTPGDSGDNQIDPLVIDPEEKDHLPKVSQQSYSVSMTSKTLVLSLSLLFCDSLAWGDDTLVMDILCVLIFLINTS